MFDGAPRRGAGCDEQEYTCIAVVYVVKARYFLVPVLITLKNAETKVGDCRAGLYLKAVITRSCFLLASSIIIAQLISYHDFPYDSLCKTYRADYSWRPEVLQSPGHGSLHGTCGYVLVIISYLLDAHLSLVSRSKLHMSFRSR
jgi:hypothetical protein